MTHIINRFDWAKATDMEQYPTNTTTQAYTTGLIELRRSTDAFRKGTMDEIAEMVSLVPVPEISEEDLALVYRAEDSNGDAYYVLINADNQERSLTLETDLTGGEVVVDASSAGVVEITKPVGVTVTTNSVTLAPLTASIIRLSTEE